MIIYLSLYVDFYSLRTWTTSKETFVHVFFLPWEYSLWLCWYEEKLRESVLPIGRDRTWKRITKTHSLMHFNRMIYLCTYMNVSKACTFKLSWPVTYACILLVRIYIYNILYIHLNINSKHESQARIHCDHYTIIIWQIFAMSQMFYLLLREICECNDSIEYWVIYLTHCKYLPWYHSNKFVLQFPIGVYYKKCK